jgi:opacity protein-like surface antigen
MLTMQLSVGRRLLRRPGLTLRYEGGYLDYARRSDLYWDPDRYFTQGLALVMRQPVFKRVVLQLEARVGYGNDDGRSALERAFGASVALAEIGGVTAEIGYRYGETGRVDSPGASAGGGYSVHSGMLSLRYRFGKT